MTIVDTLLTNAIVVTMNDDGDIFRSGAVAISGNRIVAVGPASQLAGRNTSQKRRSIARAASSCPAWSTPTPTYP